MIEGFSSKDFEYLFLETKCFPNITTRDCLLSSINEHSQKREASHVRNTGKKEKGKNEKKKKRMLGVSHQMVYSTCQMLRFLPGAVVVLQKLVT